MSTQNMSTIRVFRNIRWNKRDYESTNIVACVVPKGVECLPLGAWVDAEESALRGLTKLWMERDGIEIWGYL